MRQWRLAGLGRRQRRLADLKMWQRRLAGLGDEEEARRRSAGGRPAWTKMSMMACWPRANHTGGGGSVDAVHRRRGDSGIMLRMFIDGLFLELCSVFILGLCMSSFKGHQVQVPVGSSYMAMAQWLKKRPRGSYHSAQLEVASTLNLFSPALERTGEEVLRRPYDPLSRVRTMMEQVRLQELQQKREQKRRTRATPIGPTSAVMMTSSFLSFFLSFWCLDAKGGDESGEGSYKSCLFYSSIIYLSIF